MTKRAAESKQKIGYASIDAAGEVGDGDLLVGDGIMIERNETVTKIIVNPDEFNDESKDDVGIPGGKIKVKKFQR